MAPTCWLFWGRVQKRDSGLCVPFCLGESVSQLLPSSWTLQFLHVCHWCLSSCYPSAGAQREWVSLSPCMGSLRRTAWDSRCFFYLLNPRWFLQPEIMGIYLPATGTLDWGAWCWAGTPRSQHIPPKFLFTTHGCGASSFHNSTPSAHLDGCGFFNFIVVRLPFNTVSDSSEWWLFYNLTVIFMWLYKNTSHFYLPVVTF